MNISKHLLTNEKYRLMDHNIRDPQDYEVCQCSDHWDLDDYDHHYDEAWINIRDEVIGNILTDFEVNDPMNYNPKA